MREKVFLAELDALCAEELGAPLGYPTNPAELGRWRDQVVNVIGRALEESHRTARQDLRRRNPDLFMPAIRRSEQ